MILTLMALLAAPQFDSRPVWQPVARQEIQMRDEKYPGTIVLAIDATRKEQGILGVREVIPVARAGRLTLRYPQWLQGNHSPAGQVGSLAFLRFSAGNRTLAWTRDPVDMFAFHVDVPTGVRQIEAVFDVVPAGTRLAFSSADTLSLQWERVLLYPAGHFVSRIAVQPSVQLPDGFTGVSALDGEPRHGRVAYPITDVETLVDSPLFAGRHVRSWRLRTGVDLNVVAEQPDDLAATPDQIETHGRFVDQVDRLFGSRHFDRYDFLVSLQDRCCSGVEHHRSSENTLPPSYFKGWSARGDAGELLPHEYIHSWIGKFRRPEATWRPDFHQPIENELLWVYEGQTSYWDLVIGARSGMVEKDIILGEMASVAAGTTVQAGRAWRPLGDTVHQPIIANGLPPSFPSAQRASDFYNEGALIWLDADTLIRERSGGKRSLDDFARSFFGSRNGYRGVSTYRFEDVVTALQSVEDYDWATFLRDRIDRVDTPAPVAGIERGGYQIVFKEQPNPYDRVRMRGRLDLTHSLGGIIDAAGAIQEVRWNGPLFSAKLGPGMVIRSVNGRVFADGVLQAAITAAKQNKTPISLQVRDGSQVREVTLSYHDGLRWPWLERREGASRLDDILEAL